MKFLTVALALAVLFALASADHGQYRRGSKGIGNGYRSSDSSSSSSSSSGSSSSSSSSSSESYEHGPHGTKCGKNEVFYVCATSCPTTCQNMQHQPKPCDLKCNEKCDCKPGYVRNELTGFCVKPYDCPTPTCRENEQFNSCATSCPVTCQNMGQNVKCDFKCNRKCECKPDFIFDERTKQCGKVCPRRQ